MTRLLFVTSNRIGDAVLSSGVLARLIEALDHPRVTVVAGPAAAPLFAGVPGLSRVIAAEKRPLGRHWLGIWARTTWQLWDLVVDLRGSALSYVVPHRGRRIGGRADDSVHRVVSISRAILGPEAEVAAPRLWVSPAQALVAERLIPHGVDPGTTPVLAVAPAANWAGKQWRGRFFAELARRLTAPYGILPGARVAVLAAATERPQADPVLALLPPTHAIDLVGMVDTGEAYACLTRCTAFVGNDSGLMHLASAAGLPTLGLFGPSRDLNYAPWGPKGMVVRTQKSYEDLTGAPDYDYRTQHTLMDSLSVSTVERAAIDLWSRVGNTSPGRAAA